MAVNNHVTASTVFFSNIPAAYTEAALRPHFERVGPVVSFRIVDNHQGETVFGFCDYSDPQSAQAACSALNGKKLGSTAMKVGLADRKRKRENDVSDPGRADGKGRKGGGPSEIPDGHQFKLPPTDPLLAALNNVAIPDAYEAVEQLRLLALDNPAAARDLLEKYPQLTIATTIILQHAGKLPTELPPEASQPPPKPDNGFAPQQQKQQKQEQQQGPSDAEIMAMIESLSEEEIESTMSLTPEQIAAVPDPAARKQLTILSTRLREMASAL